MKNIAALIFISVFLTGCKAFVQKDRHFNLEENGKSLLNPGDTLVYISNLNKKAKYVVIKKISGEFYYEQSPVALNAVEGEYKDYYQYEATLIDSVGKVLTETQISTLKRIPSSISCPTEVSYSYTNYPGFISIKNCAYSIFPETGKLSASWYNFSQKNYQLSTSLKILNQEFKNVLYCDLDPSTGSTGRYVSTIYFNSQKCLLGFKYSDGEIFELN